MRTFPERERRDELVGEAHLYGLDTDGRLRRALKKALEKESSSRGRRSSDNQGD